MIRYAEETDFETVRKYDKHISETELKNAIALKRVLVLYQNGCFAGWLRFNLFWDEIPFVNMLYLFPCRSTPLGMMILKHKSIGYFFFDTIEAYGNPTCPKDSSLVMKWAL